MMKMKVRTTAHSVDNPWDVSNCSLPELSAFDGQALTFSDDITDYEDKDDLSQYLGPNPSTSFELPVVSTYNFTSATISTNESVPFIKPITLPSSGIKLEVADNSTDQEQDSISRKKRTWSEKTSYFAYRERSEKENQPSIVYQP